MLCAATRGPLLYVYCQTVYFWGNHSVASSIAGQPTTCIQQRGLLSGKGFVHLKLLQPTRVARGSMVVILCFLFAALLCDRSVSLRMVSHSRVPTAAGRLIMSQNPSQTPFAGGLIRIPTLRLGAAITYNPDARVAPHEFTRQVWIARGVFTAATGAVIANYGHLNTAVEGLYATLRSWRFFHHFSFEPLWASTVFAVCIAWWAVVDYCLPDLHQFRLQKSNSMVAWKDRLRDGLTNEVPWYLGLWIPFGGFMKSLGLGRKIATSTSLGLVASEVALGLLLYDFFFFFGHNLLHKVPLLYKNVHRKHHTSQTVRAGDSVRHSFLDGVWDVICAVAALNILRANAMSRLAFNAVAIALIVEAHCGMQLPWMLSSVFPCLFAGPRLHDVHHVQGKSNFAKFFVHLDWLFGTLDTKQTEYAVSA